jgi:VanZ family protein
LGIITTVWRKPLFIYYWLPPILWGLAVLCISSDIGSDSHTRDWLQWLLSRFVTLNPAQLNMINFYFRKTGHFMAYGIMSFLWLRAFRGHADYGPWRSCLWSLGLCLLYALMDEGIQLFCPTREASIRDVILDMSGSSVAALIFGAVWTPGAKTAAISGMVGRQTTGPE